MWKGKCDVKRIQIAVRFEAKDQYDNPFIFQRNICYDSQLTVENYWKIKKKLGWSSEVK